MDPGVDFVACDNPHANKLTIHILAAVIQHERETIAQRVRDALLPSAAASSSVPHGKSLKAAHAKAMASIQSGADKRRPMFVPLIESVQKAGVRTLRNIANALNARGTHRSRVALV